MSDDENNHELLNGFIRHAELGVTAAEYSLSIGDADGVGLDAACQQQWGLQASEVASRARAGSPVRLLGGLLARCAQGDVAALKIALEYRDRITGVDNRPKLSDSDLVQEAREILAKIESDPNIQLRLVKTK